MRIAVDRPFYYKFSIKSRRQTAEMRDRSFQDVIVLAVFLTVTISSSSSHVSSYVSTSSPRAKPHRLSYTTVSPLLAKADAFADPIIAATPPTKVEDTQIKDVTSSTTTNSITKKQKSSESRNEESEDFSIFEIVAGRAATCLVESDLRRDAKEEYSNVVSSSATNWINDATAFALQKAVDRVKLKVRKCPSKAIEFIGKKLLKGNDSQLTFSPPLCLRFPPFTSISARRRTNRLRSR